MESTKLTQYILVLKLIIVLDGILCDEFLTLLSCCHAVLAEYPKCSLTESPDKNGPHIHGKHPCNAPSVYQAASPDDKALVDAAKEQQYYFTHREAVNLTVGGIEIDDAQVYSNF